MAGNRGCALAIIVAWAIAPATWGQAPIAAVPKQDAADSAASAATGQAPQFTAETGTNVSPEPRVYVTTDYILWWVRRGPLPDQALVTTGPAGVANAGLIGQPGTQTLFGSPNGLDWHGASGARVTA